MAGLIVSAFTGAMVPLLGKLATLMGEEFAKLKNLRKEVKFISDELTCMKDALESISYLHDLDPQTHRWRDIVREMSYDIEDIIDEFMQNNGERNKDDGFVSNTIERLKILRARHKIAGQIEDIKKLVIETNVRRQRYKLDIPLYNPHTPLSSNVVIDPRVSTLYENAANLVGVEAPAEDLVSLLANVDKQLKVVSIVGFGGLGKTTLANFVYGRLKGKFNQSAFVPVSQKPDIPKLLHSLLSQLGSTTSNNCELNFLLEQLRGYLQNKSYFIVIDDIWDVQAWGIIKCAFPENNLGSRVIVTTRIRDVAKTCCLHQSDHILEMKPLSNEDSRRLFLDRTFGSDEACPLHLRDALDEVLKICGGLPLAIICISSMLASEDPYQKERWEHVTYSLGSATNLTLEGMRQILSLSYKDLPPHLRTCFLYLGMYPEDYKIVRSNLERQWMAEGFISKENGKDMEKVARSYFNELVNRSLIQPVDFDERGSVTSCRVHDMMLDLILIKSTEENFFTIVDNPRAITGLDYKIRRLSMHMKNYDDMSYMANINMSQVRTIMLFGSCSEISSLSGFKFLRVFFCTANTANRDLLTRMCKLYHLRYLHVDDVLHWNLPLQISLLQHLETLHLYNPDISKYYTKGLPDGIGNMKSVRYLCGFDLLENSLENIKGLGELANLRYLSLVWQSDQDDMMRRVDALCSSLGRLGSLQELVVEGMGARMDGLLPFSPPPSPYHLETLRMSACLFTRVPSWMGELRYLSELQCRVVELLNDGVGILADLPVLSVLDVYLGKDCRPHWVGIPIEDDLQLADTQSEPIVFSRKGFSALNLFRFSLRFGDTSYLTFQPGAMPKLQRLELNFWSSESEQNGPAPVGLEHLLALKGISACVNRNRMIIARRNPVSRYDKTESAFRSAISKHPGNPRFAFSTDY